MSESSRKGMVGRLVGVVGGWGTLAAFVVVAAAAVGVRLVELPLWSDPWYMVEGERIMATHDAYAWLAGALGSSRYAGAPLARFMALLHAATGLSLGVLGFWLPVVMAPLAALPLCLWLGRMERPEAGVAAGVLASAGIAYLIRSRVGYLDTDVWSLFFAVAAAVGFAAWLAPLVRGDWFGLRREAPGEPGGPEPGLPGVLARGLALGVFCNLYTGGAAGLLTPLTGFSAFYTSGHPIVWALYGTALVAGLVLARPGRRTAMVMGLAVILASWFLGWWGLAGAAAAWAVARFRPRALRFHGLNVGLWLGLAFLAGFALVRGLGDLAAYKDLFLSYLKFSRAEQAVAEVRNLNLPSVMGSVREVVSLGPLQALRQIAGHWTVFILAMAGYLWCLWRRPALLVLLPLLGLGLASIRMGNRFAMYACPVAGLGLGLGAAELLVRLGAARVWRWAAQAVLCGLVLVFTVLQARDFVVSPVLSAPFAETLVALGRRTPAQAVLWQWWDYGYAAQYYAGRDTFGDGGRHSGDWLYPLALVLTTDKPLQAGQVMKYFGEQWGTQVAEAKALGRAPHPPVKLEFYSVQPMRDLAAMGPERAAELIRGLGRTPRDFPGTAPEQYLVVAWDYLSFAGWISTYGTWDVATGTNAPGHSSLVWGNVRLDARQGVLETEKGSVLLSKMIVAEADGRTAEPYWPRYGGVYAVANKADGRLFVMDRTIYDSMMVRLLLDDPSRFEPTFELVVDNAPWARAYRVR